MTDPTNLLNQSTLVAQNAAKMIGGSFTQGVGFTPNTPSPGSGNLNTNPNTPTTTQTPPNTSTVNTNAPDTTNTTSNSSTNTQGNTNTGNTTTSTDPNVNTRDTAQGGLNADQAQRNDALTTFNNSVDSILNGSMPLNSSQQSQITGLQSQYKDLIDKQNLQNTNSQGVANIRGYQTGSAEYDPSFQANTIGSIVTAGIQKVASLNNELASKVGELTIAFQKEDYAMIKDKYDAFTAAQDKRDTVFQKTIDDANASIKDANDKQQKVTDAVNAVATEAAKNGADAKTIAAISGAKNVQDAINASGGFLQTASGALGDYLQYKRDTEAQGLTPLDYTSYKDQQDAKASKQKNIDAYNNAYNSAAGKNAADNANGGGGGYNGTTQKQQIALEQQYRQILGKEFSARTGALGIENAKVNQANHLNSLVVQYYDPKTGNYNIPKSQYGELILGLANLVSPTSVASDSVREEINTKTAAGDINGAIAYITGTPQTGNTQAIIKNFIDSIDRQAETAVRNREAALGNMKDLAPTDLDPARVDALNKATNMVPFEGQDRISKTNISNFLNTSGDKMVTLSDGQHSLWYVAQTLADTPGSTPASVEQYLKANGWMQ